MLEKSNLFFGVCITTLFLNMPRQTAAMTNSDLQEIKCKVFKAIDSFQGLGPQPLLAKCVRLTFHDCVGGCDGKVDLSVHGNEGLDIPINQLQEIYNGFAVRGISRADFWAAAGTFAIFKGVLNTAGTNSTAPNITSSDFPPLKFYYGRRDGSGVPMALPNPHGGIEQVVGFFSQVFNMTVQDSVAIMGAHTLGGASKNNSGFDGIRHFHSFTFSKFNAIPPIPSSPPPGPWTDQPDAFDNTYYQQLLRAHGWSQVLLRNSRCFHLVEIIARYRTDKLLTARHV